MIEFDAITQRKFGTSALMLGLAFSLLSATIYAGAFLRRESVITQKEANAEECNSRLRTLGAQTVTQANEDTMIVTWKGLEGGVARLGDASAAAMSCPGWTMTKFCMGQACQIPGANLVLSRVM